MARKPFIEKYFQAGSTSINNLLLHHYHEIGMTTAELLVYIELRSYIDRGQTDPAVSRVASHLGTSEDQVYELISQMTKDQLMVQKMQKSADGKESMHYDFAPLLHKLERFVENGEDAHQQEQVKSQRQDLFTMIETEFGRMLNPIEMSLVNDWIDRDHYDIDVIKLALRETVLNGKYNFKYMDRILSNWSHQNLTTPQAVESAMHQYENNRYHESVNESGDDHASGQHIPIFKINPDAKRDHKK